VQPVQVNTCGFAMAFTGTAGGVVHVTPLRVTPVTLATEAPALARVKVTE